MNTKAKYFGSLGIGTLCTLLASHASAELIGGVEFPNGQASFADRLVSFDLRGATGVLAPHADGAAALGIPDYSSSADNGYVSLGNATTTAAAAELVVEFVDNRLIDVTGDDLYIFEIGATVENTLVDVSVDGSTWYSLGEISGGTRGIDLADFPSLPKGALYRYVRLQDSPGGTTSGSPYAGPDIDAVGAIGTDVADDDKDGVHNAGDNCPAIANADQADADHDGIGDLCDPTPTSGGTAGAGNAGAAGATGLPNAAGAPGAGTAGVSSVTTAGAPSAGMAGSSAAAAGTSAAAGSPSEGTAGMPGTAGGRAGASGSSSKATGGTSGHNSTEDEEDDVVKNEVSCSCRLGGESQRGTGSAFGLLLLAAALLRRKMTR